MAGSPVRRYVGSLRRRATALLVLRATIACIGAGALAFAIGAAAAGPVIGTSGAVFAWVGVGFAVLLVGYLVTRPISRLRGPAAAELLCTADPHLASEARSAWELEESAAGGHSAALVEAHRAQVGQRLASLRPDVVAPGRILRHSSTAAGLGALAVATLVVFGGERANAGAYALLHPNRRTEDGAMVAAVVAQVRARLVYPAYTGRAPVEIKDPVGIEAPQGTSIEIEMQPRVSARAARLQVAGRDVGMKPDASGAFRGRFVLREGGPLRIQVRDGSERWLADPAVRWLRATDDEAPRVRLVEPNENRTVELEQAVDVVWTASDDVALRSVDLVVKMPVGKPIRRTLVRVDEAERSAEGRTELVLGEIGAEPGDEIVVWVEALDTNDVTGPHVGRSEERTLRIASESTRRLASIAGLEEALGRGLDALAERLEHTVPDASEEALARFARTNALGRHFAAALSELEDRASTGASRKAEAALLRAMARRVEAGLVADERAHRPRPAPTKRRVQVDADLVDELEKDVLTLSDLIGRARLEDAAEITRELESLRRHMASLLSELRRTDSPEARNALMAALARAEARMRELMERIAAMGEDVPSDHVNAQELAAEPPQDALAALKESLERGDLDAAEKNLTELERRISSLAEALGSAEQSFAESRFGPRERALAEAMDSLAGLEAEQRQLAQRSEEMRRQAADRAVSATGATSEGERNRLAGRARQARTALEKLGSENLGPVEEEFFERARQRLIDSEDALRTGDLGEAGRMARQASSDLDALSRDLELSSLMFPGQGGRTSESARAAREAADRARELRHAIDQAIPNMQDYVDPQGRKEMRENAKRQSEAQRAAERLAESFDRGPDGSPLLPDASRNLREASEAMARGRRALEKGDPLESARAQEDAARRLTELREELEDNKRSSSSSAGGQGGSEGGQGRADNRRRVRIPGAEHHESPMALRRRLLDAMRENPPQGYEDSVKRYYEELLR